MIQFTHMCDTDKTLQCVRNIKIRQENEEIKYYLHRCSTVKKVGIR